MANPIIAQQISDLKRDNVRIEKEIAVRETMLVENREALEHLQKLAPQSAPAEDVKKSVHLPLSSLPMLASSALGPVVPVEKPNPAPVVVSTK